MAIDWSAHYDSIYGELGVVASVVLGDTAATEVEGLTVIDKTSGLAALIDNGTITVQTIRALAAIRMTELADNSIAREDLKGATITFNSADWIIHSTRPAPSPTGESQGELYLLLEDA